MTWTELPTDIESYLRNVRVKNVGETDAVLYWNSIPYIIRAGESSSVPFEVVVNWLGDPRSGSQPQVLTSHGVKTWVPTRTDEITRLRQLYGMHNIGGESDIVAAMDPETEKFMDYPRIEVTDTAGNRLWTVLEDPSGEKAHGRISSPHETRVVNEQEALIQRLQEQVEMLVEERNRREAGFDRGPAYMPISEHDLPSDEAPDPSVAPLPQRPMDKLDWGTVQPFDPDDA